MRPERIKGDFLLRAKRKGSSTGGALVTNEMGRERRRVSQERVRSEEGVRSE